MITLYLPEAYYFDNVYADVGAGSLEFTELNAADACLEGGAGYIGVDCGRFEHLNASVGAGVVSFTGIEVTNLDIEAGMGECAVEGAVYGDAWVECSMGNVEMTLVGNERDFNYYLQGSMGNIDVGSESLHGFGHEKYIDNNAAKTMDIECSMGNITVDFTE